MPSAIDPSQIPGKDIDPGAIETNARTIGTIASSVRDNGSDVHRKWQGMAGVYSAPESGTLLGLMQPVSTQATQAGDNLDVVSAALTQFAADVRPIKAELDSLRAQAQAFVDTTVANGVRVREINPAWTSTHGVYGTTYGAASYSPYSSSSTGGTTTAADVPQYRYVTKEWHEDQDAVDRNNELISAVNTQQVALWEAERTCANKIRGLYGGAKLHAFQSENDANGYGLSEIPEGTEMPWGAPVERSEGCGEATLNFVVKDFLWEGLLVGGVWGTVTGLGTLVLGYNPATGDWFSGDAYGAAWGSLGLLLASGAMNSAVLGPILWADQGMEAFGGGGFLPQEVRDFKAKADEAALNTGKALIAWDKWQDDPGTALGESVFNVGTILIPAGAAIAGVKTAGTAANVLSKMARVVDLIDPASLAVNGAVRLGGIGLGSLDNLIGGLDLGAKLDPPHIEVYTAADSASAIRALDDWGVDLNTVTAHVDGLGNNVLEFPGGKIELPTGSFDNALGGIRGADGGADASITAPVREPELVHAGGVRGETGPGPVNSIVDEAPVRTETGGSGESTVIREPESTTGGGTGHPADGGGGSSAGGSIGGDGSSASHTGGSDMPAANEPTPAAASGSSGSDTGSTQSGYTTLDGKPYTPWTSHDQVAQFTDAEPHLTAVAAEHGLTMADLYHLVHERPVTSLTPDEALLVLDIRESVELPANGEIMQKVIGEQDLHNLLTRRYADLSSGGPVDTIGGFVGRAADAQKLITSDDLIRGFGLDYEPGRTVPDQFLAPDGGTYAVRFEMTDDFDLQIPARDAGDQAGLLLDRNGQPYYHPSSVNPLGPDNPYHGNGFVGNGAKEIIPEYHLPAYTELPDLTEVWRITPSGGEELVAALVGGRWHRF